MKFFLTTIAVFCISCFAQAGEITKDPLSICPLKVSQTVPSLTVKSLAGKVIDLNAEIAKKPTVLIFYRGGWCPYCNIHLGQLKTVEKDLKKLGYQLIAISPDSVDSLKETLEKNTLTYALFSDSDASVIKSMGLAYKVDNKTYKQLLGYGVNLEKASGQKHHILPVPAVYLLDKKGRVDFTFSSPDYKVRINTDVLLVAAKAAIEK